jgi:hypothetical protein
MAYYRRTRGTGIFAGLEIEARSLDDIPCRSETVAKGARGCAVAAAKRVTAFTEGDFYD